MAEGYRLGGLQMGEARHYRRRMLLGAVDQGGLKPAHFGLAPGQCVAHPEAEIRRHLVVARTRRMQTASGGADQFAEARFDIHVDVFQFSFEDEPSVGNFIFDSVEPVLNLGAVFGRDNALGDEHFGMRFRRCDILGVEPAIEIDRGVDRRHEVIGCQFETPAPDGIHTLLGFWVAAHVPIPRWRLAPISGRLGPHPFRTRA